MSPRMATGPPRITPAAEVVSQIVPARVQELRCVVHTRFQEADAPGCVGANRTEWRADHKIPHQRGHVAVTDEIEVVAVVVDAEEVRRVSEVRFEPDDPAAHPADAGTVIHLPLELVLEVVADSTNFGIAAERRTDEGREQPVGRRSGWSGRAGDSYE